MRGEEPLPERSVTLSLGLDLAIPHDYVDDENWRMMIYKKIARARRRRRARGDARARSPTGSGSLRAAVRRLVEYARLRARAERLGVTSITRQAGRVHLRFAEDAASTPTASSIWSRRTPGAEPLARPRPDASRPRTGTPCSPACIALLPALGPRGRLSLGIQSPERC